MKRWRGSAVALRARALRVAVTILALAAAACASPGAPPPSPGDCVLLRVTSNGWHTNVAAPAHVFGDDHPLVGVFPEAGHFLIGWGERAFYIAEDPGLGLGAKAITPPSPSVVHVIAGADPVEETIWRPREMVDVAVSEAGAARLAQALADALAYDDAGAPIILGEGRVRDASVFLEARGRFHVFNMCNNWSAARLVEAGIPIQPRLAFSASSLLGGLERRAPQSCPQ